MSWAPNSLIHNGLLDDLAFADELHEVAGCLYPQT